MAKETWALDLGEWSLKVARGRIEKKSDKVTVDLYDEIRYDTLEVGEEPTALDKLQAGLDVFAGKYEVGKRDDLCVAVSGSEVFSRFISLPPVPESISEIIHYEARQQIPFDINDVVWDYQPLKEEHQPGEEIEVGLFALKRENVEEFMRLLAPWRRNLRLVQDAALAVYNLLRFEGQVDEPMIVLDMGAATTNLLVINPPRFWLRPLLVGGNSITSRLQSHFGISYQESERIKERASESAREAQLLRVIRPVVGNMLSEIQRSLGYYKSLAKGVKFTKILTLGNAFKLRGLQEALAEGLQYPVEELADLRQFEFGELLSKKDFLPDLSGACVVLGLLVQGVGRGHIRINLVPEDLARAAVMARKRPMIIAAAAGLLAIAAVFTVSERVYGREVVKYIHTGEDTYNKMRILDRQLKAAQKEAEQEERKTAVLAERAVPRDMLLRIVPDIVQAVPEDTVYISGMRFSWMDRKQFERALKGDREVEMGMPVSPFQPGLGPGESPMGGSFTPLRDLMSRPPASREPSSSSTRREGRARRQERAQDIGPILVLRMDCESTVIEKGLNYIEQEVIKRLRERPSADMRPIFNRVELVGKAKSVFRRASDGAKIGQFVEGEEVIEFVAFRVLAEVSLGGPEAEGRTSAPQ